MNTQQKVAFITGGNRGLGLETARGLGRLGIEVVIGVRDPDKGEEAVAALRNEGIHASAIGFDATKPSTFQAVYDHFASQYGRLDILVNNAGIALGEFFAPNASTVSQDVLRRTFDVNFFAVIELTQILLPLIRQAPAGRIVNLSSILGSLGTHCAPDSPIAPAKEVAYNASKTALNAYTDPMGHSTHKPLEGRTGPPNSHKAFP